MAGAATLQTAATGSLSGSVQQRQHQVSASMVNSFRIAAVTDRLSIHLQGGGTGNVTELFNLCLSLARGIDFAVANNEVPGTAKQLPGLLKQVCQQRQNIILHTGIMVLMVSVKNACAGGWFSDKEGQELLALASEIASIFCSSEDLNSTVNYSIISKIVARFYPLMSMGKILASFEIKPGYGTYVVDFHISKSTAHAPQEKIRLFVAQTDNIETSTCIISPQQVNFVLNGKTVDRRTNVFMDSGPQMPTNVSTLLKYGTNLLQAVGQFNGDYIILVAFMSVKSPTTPTIPDYVQHDVATQDLDSDIIEGPSRISLNCPISYARIKTPVKGHSCKHLQCFDYDNYVDINLRRPSWRCPHCNHPVCYTDVRLDQNMVKVLREVGDTVADIIISADGSWKAVFESDDPINQTLHETLNRQNEPIEAPISTNTLPLLLDLTKDDDIMDEMIWTGSEDRKPVIDKMSIPSVSNNEVRVHHSDAPPIDDDFWSGLCFPDGSAPSIGTGVNLVSSSVSSDAISLALNRGAEGINNSLGNSFSQHQFSAANKQLQLRPRVNPATNHEYRAATIPQNGNRNSTIIQALPVPSHTPSPQPPQQRPRLGLNNTPVRNSSSVAPKAPSFSPVSLNPVSSQHHHPAIQNRTHQGQRAASPAPLSVQLPGAYRSEHQNLRQQQGLNQMIRGPSSALARPSTPVPWIPQGGTIRTPVVNGQTAASQISKYTYAGRQPTTGRLASTPVLGQTPRPAQPYPVNGAADMLRTPVNVRGAAATNDLASDQSWRLGGRMRGSLSGKNYSAALNELIIQPTQSSQPPTSQPVVKPLALAPGGVSFASTVTTVPSLEALLANTRAANSTRPQ